MTWLACQPDVGQDRDCSPNLSEMTAVEAFLRPRTGHGPDPAKHVRMVTYPYPAHPACSLYFFGTCQAVRRMAT